MSKRSMGNCEACGSPVDDCDTMWMLKGMPYHATCIKRDKSLLEKWRAAEWHQKEVL